MDADRFLKAQEWDHAQAVAELSAGRKRTHWMWYIFPQLAALGRSERAKHFGLAGLDDARAYLAHPVLGPRLHEAVAAAVKSGETDPVALMGEVDALKLCSCLTLFAAAADDPAPFETALERFFDGRRDAATLRLIGG